jgi:hypothetical protein
VTLGTGPTQGIGARTWMKRALVSVLAPLTGVRGSGSALVHATGADTTLPNATYGIPVMVSAAGGAQADASRLVKTVGDVVVTAAGVSVPVVSVLGGAQHAFPIGTKILWSPAVPGVEGVSLLDTALAGATDPTAAGTLRRLVTLDQLGLGGAKGVQPETWKAKLGVWPAGVLAWTGSKRGDRVGKGARLRPLTYRLFVLSGTQAGPEPRDVEAETVLDYLEGLLEDRAAVDGEEFSNPTVAVTGSGMLTADDGAFVYFVDLEAHTTIERIDARTFAAWLETQAQLVTDPDTEHPDPADALVVADVSLNQGP